MENQKREFDITKFKEFIKKERTVEQLEKEFELSEFEIMGYVSKLKKAGLNIIVAKKDDAISVINLGDRKLNNDNSYNFDIGDSNNIKIAVISDTRLCSKFQ